MKVGFEFYRMFFILPVTQVAHSARLLKLNQFKKIFLNLEQSNNIYTIAADFKWNDLGSWKSLFDILPKNKDKNHYEGDVISLQSNNNLIISPNRLTAVIGIKDLTIINLNDATLIMPHEKAEEVKNIVEMLKSLNNNKYL